MLRYIRQCIEACPGRNRRRARTGSTTLFNTDADSHAGGFHPGIQIPSGRTPSLPTVLVQGCLGWRRGEVVAGGGALRTVAGGRDIAECGVLVVFRKLVRWWHVSLVARKWQQIISVSCISGRMICAIMTTSIGDLTFWMILVVLVWYLGSGHLTV